MWRPEGWRCPYLGKKANRYFELGADAMLGELRKMGTRLPAWDFEQPRITQVFIPDDDVKKFVEKK